MNKYYLTEGCFELMGGLLTLNPADRLTAEQEQKSETKSDLDKLREDSAAAFKPKPEPEKSIAEQIMEKRKQEIDRAKKDSDAKREAASKKEAELPLPPGWSKHWSSSKGRYYYHNEKTKTNQWYPPGSKR